MSNYVGYRRRLKQRAKDIIRNTTYPPQVNPKKFESLFMNCYSFALNIPIDDVERQFFSPGCIADYHCDPAIYDSVLKGVRKDLYSLGLKFRVIDLKQKNNFVLNQGEYAIAVYREISTFHDMPFNFHIIRSDQNGIWHDKAGWTLGFHMYPKVPDLTEHNLKLEGILAISKK